MPIILQTMSTSEYWREFELRTNAIRAKEVTAEFDARSPKAMPKHEHAAESQPLTPSSPVERKLDLELSDREHEPTTTRLEHIPSTVTSSKITLMKRKGSSKNNSTSLVCRVPVELWNEIFEWATTIPGKDEFSKELAYYDILPSQETGLSAILTTSELSQLIRTRLTFIKVCKRWYYISIEALYRHLRINYKSSNTSRSYLRDFLTKNPNIAYAVRRLTVPEPTETEYIFHLTSSHSSQSFSLYIFHSLTPLLPRLCALSCPYQFIRDSPTTIDIAMLKLAKGGSLHLDGVQFWHGVRALNLDLNDRAIPTNLMKDVVFSRLESLRIRSSNESMIDFITGHWQTPVLRTFSVDSRHPVAWANFLRKNKMMLQYLEISISEPSDHLGVSQISMPSLTMLLLKQDGYSAWSHVINAPILNRLVLFDMDWKEFGFSSDRSQGMLAWSKYAIAVYPTLRSLCLYDRYGCRQEKTTISFGEKLVFVETRQKMRPIDEVPIIVPQPVFTETRWRRSPSKSKKPRTKKPQTKKTQVTKPKIKQLLNKVNRFPHENHHEQLRNVLQTHRVKKAHDGKKWQASCVVKGVKVYGRASKSQMGARQSAVSKALHN